MLRPIAITTVTLLTLAVFSQHAAHADDPWPAPTQFEKLWTRSECREFASPECWQGNPCTPNPLGACNNTTYDYLKSDQWRKYGKCVNLGIFATEYCMSYGEITCAKLSFHLTSNCNQAQCTYWVVVGGLEYLCDPLLPHGVPVAGED